MSDLKFTPPPDRMTPERRRGDLIVLKIFRGVFWLFVGLFIGLAICNARSEGWATTDRVLFGTYLTASALDAAQTIHALDQRHPNGQPKFKEVNPLYGEQPSDSRIILTKLVSAGVIYLIADRVPSARRTTLWLVNALQIGVVAHNASIGMRIGF